MYIDYTHLTQSGGPGTQTTAVYPLACVCLKCSCSFVSIGFIRTLCDPSTTSSTPSLEPVCGNTDVSSAEVMPTSMASLCRLDTSSSVRPSQQRRHPQKVTVPCATAPPPSINQTLTFTHTDVSLFRPFDDATDGYMLSNRPGKTKRHRVPWKIPHPPRHDLHSS